MPPASWGPFTFKCLASRPSYGLWEAPIRALGKRPPVALRSGRGPSSQPPVLAWLISKPRPRPGRWDAEGAAVFISISRLRSCLRFVAVPTRGTQRQCHKIRITGQSWNASEKGEITQTRAPGASRAVLRSNPIMNVLIATCVGSPQKPCLQNDYEP